MRTATPTTTTPNRRAAQEPNPDGPLLALAAAFMAEWPAIEAWNRDEAGDAAVEAAGEAALHRANELLDQITALPAVTLGGIHAKARCALIALNSMDLGYDDPDVLAAQSALADLTREIVA